MKKISLFILSCIAAVSLTTSCEILELEPTDAFSNSSAWANTSTADSYTIGFYSAIRDASELYKSTGNGVGCLSDTFSDILKQRTYYNYGSYNAALLEPDFFKSGGAGPLECWSPIYDRVKRHNEYLYNAPKDGAKFGNDFLLPRIAEVRFIRAFCYFQLARIYGGVVLRDEKNGIDSNKDKNKARMTEAQTYEFIISELEAAANNLPVKWAEPANFGRATKAAAYALQCRAALYAKNWAKAIEAAGNAKKNGGELMPTYKSVFDTDPTQNKEVLLAVSFISGTFTHRFDAYFCPVGDGTASTVYCAATPTAELVDSYEMLDGSKFDWNNPDHAANPYSGRDPRMEATILYNGANWKGRKIETFVGGKDGFTPYSAIATTPASATTTGYYIRKFLDEGNTDFVTKGSAHFDIVLRYGETLLNLAEALAEQNYQNNKTAALAALNEVRTRGGIMPALDASDKSDFMAKLRHERMVELAIEGHRYWDLRRWRLCMTMINGQQAHAVKITKSDSGVLTYDHPSCDANKTRYFKESYYLLSIPSSERTSNKLCTNNEGWANN